MRGAFFEPMIEKLVILGGDDKKDTLFESKGAWIAVGVMVSVFLAGRDQDLGLS
ncbi:hypothetical protein [Aeromonas bivalvium]|uniref:hypothetical protein n=1 Tax=Aeromonas bivalvium TaxID=440079 RepID=UPI000B047870